MNSLLCCQESTKQALEKLIRATTAPIRKVFRVRIILLAMQGNSHSGKRTVREEPDRNF